MKTKKTNRRLNLFDFYSQEGAVIIEKNCTRNLAVVLKSDLHVLERFMLFIAKKSNCTEVTMLEKNDDWNTNIEVLAKTIDTGFKKIIGITLTTASLDEETKLQKDKTTDNILDIVISYGQTLIIVEAKRNKASAKKQLESQIKQIKENYTEAGVAAPDEYIGHVSWEELMIFFDELNSVMGLRNIILSDYLDHIQNHWPEILPPIQISKLSLSEIPKIHKRLERFQKNYIEIKGGEDKTRSYGNFWIGFNKSIYLSNEYVNEFLLEYNEGCFDLVMIYGVTVPQSKKFYERFLFNEEMESSFHYDGIQFPVDIIPTLVAADSYGRDRCFLPLCPVFYKDELRKKDKLLELIGRKKFNEAKKLAKSIDGDVLREETQIFLADVEKKFKDTSMVTLKLCFKIKIKLDFNFVQQKDNIDLCSASKDDVLVTYVDGLIEKTLSYIDERLQKNA